MNEESILREMMPLVEQYVIKNDTNYIIQEGYEWLREVITLYAKQHNLIEATLNLIENRMNEEAIVLARSVMNNSFLIGYLMNDNEDRTRLKEYIAQPILTQRFFLKNLEKSLKGDFGKRMKNKGSEMKWNLDNVKTAINKTEKEIEALGYKVDKKPLSIMKIANKSDEHGFEMYLTFYAEASKFEHSDISTLNIYRKNLGDYPNHQVFGMDTRRTNEDLRKTVMSMIFLSYTDSFQKIAKCIRDKDMKLFRGYNVDKLKEIEKLVIP